MPQTEEGEAEADGFSSVCVCLCVCLSVTIVMHCWKELQLSWVMVHGSVSIFGSLACPKERFGMCCLANSGTRCGRCPGEGGQGEEEGQSEGEGDSSSVDVAPEMKQQPQLLGLGKFV